jgi:ABC-type transport system involved in cytochrome c biogenesis ATPase subunit
MADNHLKKLTLKNFSVFKSATFNFASGINIIIGENGTGKTHLLKLLYSMLKPFDATQSLPEETPVEMKARFNAKLLAVFRPDDRQPGRLVTNARGVHGANARLEYNRNLFVDFDITSDGKLRPLRRSFKVTPSSLFVPPREALAMYEGFTSAYEKRELSFDETYYDFCKALSASPLKGEAKKKVEDLLKELESLIGGKLKKRGGRFYLEQEGHDDVEAHMLAEGLRKVGSLYRLIGNGGLAPDSILFMDELEAGLNPRLISRLVRILHVLAGRNIQIFIATHDFLLSQELSLAAEYRTKPEVSIRFFALSRDEEGGVTPQSGDTLADLIDNPILEEFAAHYDREQDLFRRLPAGAGQGKGNGKKAH